LVPFKVQNLPIQIWREKGYYFACPSSGKGNGGSFSSAEFGGECLQIEYGAQSDQGRVRTSNEDYFVANPESKIFLVADGMGGHAAGEIASRMAAEKVVEVLSRGGPESSMEDLLQLAVNESNTDVHEDQKTHSEHRGMGSTLTVLTFADGNYCIAQVGDSRAYLLRNSILTQLTQDHSLVWPLYKSGVISKDDISRNPRKNLITRSIGTQPQVEADLQGGLAMEGDLFLLCSDGLTDVLLDSDISRILLNSHTNAQEYCDLLVAAANSGGGPDNITIVIVRITGN
jgi:PPM family protein phosphatase